MTDRSSAQDMLGQKLELLQQFCRLTELLLPALSGEDMQKIHDLLEARQKIIKQVDDLDGQVVNCQVALSSGDKDAVCREPAGEMQQIKVQIRECLLRVREMDKQMQAAIEQKCRTMANNMGSVRVARRAETMYRKKAASRYGYFVDKKK